MFAYQQHQRYFAQAAEGLEESSAEELRGLGARDLSPSYRGLYFAADQPTLYRITYRSRLTTASWPRSPSSPATRPTTCTARPS